MKWSLLTVIWAKDKEKGEQEEFRFTIRLINLKFEVQELYQVESHKL